MRALSREEVRQVDARAIAEYGLPGIVLMENAGRGAAELLCRLHVSGPVVICAGKGNNGGDGFVIARHLDLREIEVRVVLCCDPAQLTGDAVVNYNVLRAAGLAGQVLPSQDTDRWLDDQLAGASWVVDALLGTGTTGTIREPYRSVIEAINRSECSVLAVDLPSGMDCDTGVPLGACVRATHTATFVARKQGFERPAARQWTGEVHVIDIGVPRKLLREILDGRPS